MTDKEINKKIQDMIKLPKTSNKRILTFVKKKECQTASLTPSTLGMLFEVYAGVKYNAEDDTTCFSRTITIEELEKIHPNFRSTNGCQWARSDTSYLGKKYKIKREHKNRKVYSVSVIFTNLIITSLDDSGEEIMVSLIKDGVFTDVALKKILEEIEKTGERRNLTTLKAYVLDTIGKNTNTFRI